MFKELIIPLTVMIQPDAVMNDMALDCNRGVQSSCIAYDKRFTRNKSRVLHSQRTLHSTGVPSRVNIKYHLTGLKWSYLNTDSQVANEKAKKLYRKYH